MTNNTTETLYKHCYSKGFSSRVLFSHPFTFSFYIHSLSTTYIRLLLTLNRWRKEKKKNIPTISTSSFSGKRILRPIKPENFRSCDRYPPRVLPAHRLHPSVSCGFVHRKRKLALLLVAIQTRESKLQL